MNPHNESNIYPQTVSTTFMTFCGHNFRKNIHMTTNRANITTRRPVVDAMSKNQSIGLTVARHPGRWGGGGRGVLSWRMSGRCQSVRRRGIKKGYAGVKGLTVSHMI